MKNNKLILSLGLVAMLLLGGFAYFSNPVKAENLENQKNTMMQEAVQKGIISSDQAQKLQELHQEQRQQRFEERIGQAVEDGTITQEEANEIKNWHENRPEAMSKLQGLQKGFGKGQKACDCQ